MDRPPSKVPMREQLDVLLQHLKRVEERLDINTVRTDVNTDTKNNASPLTNWERLGVVPVLLASSVFNMVLNVWTLLDFGVAFTSNNVPVLECKSVRGDDGKPHMKCYRSEKITNKLKISDVIPNNDK